MKAGDLVTCELHHRGEEIGTIEYCVGIIIDRGAADSFHSTRWNVMIRREILSIPTRMIEVQSEDR